MGAVRGTCNIEGCDGQQSSKGKGKYYAVCTNHRNKRKKARWAAKQIKQEND